MNYSNANNNDGDCDARMRGEENPESDLLAGTHAARSIEDEKWSNCHQSVISIMRQNFPSDRSNDGCHSIASKHHVQSLFVPKHFWSTLFIRLFAINWRRCAVFSSIFSSAWRLSWRILIFMRYSLTNYPWLICARRSWDEPRSRVKKFVRWISRQTVWRCCARLLSAIFDCIGNGDCKRRRSHSWGMHTHTHTPTADERHATWKITQ